MAVRTLVDMFNSQFEENKILNSHIIDKGAHTNPHREISCISQDLCNRQLNLVKDRMAEFASRNF